SFTSVITSNGRVTSVVIVTSVPVVTVTTGGPVPTDTNTPGQNNQNNNNNNIAWFLLKKSHRSRNDDIEIPSDLVSKKLPKPPASSSASVGNGSPERLGPKSLPPAPSTTSGTIGTGLTSNGSAAWQPNTQYYDNSGNAAAAAGYAGYDMAAAAAYHQQQQQQQYEYAAQWQEYFAQNPAAYAQYQAQMAAMMQGAGTGYDYNDYNAAMYNTLPPAQGAEFMMMPPAVGGDQQQQDNFNNRQLTESPSGKNSSSNGAPTDTVLPPTPPKKDTLNRSDTGKDTQHTDSTSTYPRNPDAGRFGAARHPSLYSYDGDRDNGANTMKTIATIGTAGDETLERRESERVSRAGSEKKAGGKSVTRASTYTNADNLISDYMGEEAEYEVEEEVVVVDEK
ncbi:hypothetical protein HDU76_005203, partial [Blyttiomyces sp. JEL0837]